MSSKRTTHVARQTRNGFRALEFDYRARNIGRFSELRAEKEGKIAASTSPLWRIMAPLDSFRLHTSKVRKIATKT